MIIREACINASEMPYKSDYMHALRKCFDIIKMQVNPIPVTVQSAS
jgi:hypothetical protein